MALCNLLLSAGHGRQNGRCALRHALVAFSLAASGPADARTLQALLRMPFEYLLTLTISTPGTARHGSPVPWPLSSPKSDGGAHGR